MAQLPARPAPNPLLVNLAFVAVSIAWGTTYGGIKVAVESMPPFLMAGVRFTLAGAVLLAVLLACRVRLPSGRDFLRLSAVGCILLAFGNGLLCWSEQHVDSAFAALVVNVGPFMYLGFMALAGESVPRRAWLGLAIGFLGLLMLVGPRLHGLGKPMGDAAVPMALVLAALTVGPFFWSSGSFVANRYPAKSCSSIMGSAVQTLMGGLGALAVSWVVGEWKIATWPTARSLWAMAYLIVVGSWIGYVCYMYCVEHLPPHRTASITYINNLVAIVVGAVLLREVVTPWMIAGGATILIGVFVVNQAKAAAGKTAAEAPKETEAEGAT